MGRKKNNSSGPRRKRMRMLARIQAAQQWLPTYTGKNIVRGYARHFAVDLLCSVKELEMLGHQFTPEYKEQLKKSLEGQIKQKQERKRLIEEKKKKVDTPFESDDRFFYIAGHTSGGAPYGVTWEKMGCDDEAHLFEVDRDEEMNFYRAELFSEDNEEDEIPF